MKSFPKCQDYIDLSSLILTLSQRFAKGKLHFLYVCLFVGPFVQLKIKVLWITPNFQDIFTKIDGNFDLCLAKRLAIMRVKFFCLRLHQWEKQSLAMVSPANISSNWRS